MNIEAIDKSDEIDLEIFEALVNWVDKHDYNNGTIEYNKLSKEVDNPAVISITVGPRLGRVSGFCIENGFAPISVIVVGHESGISGSGFFGALNSKDLLSGKDEVEEWSLLYKKVYETPIDDWKELLEKYRVYVDSLKK